MTRGADLSDDEGAAANGRARLADVQQVLRHAELDRVRAHPQFDTVCFEMVDSWARHAEEDRSMVRTLRDVGNYMAGAWALSLAASPQDLTHASLSELLEVTGLGSRNRAHAMLVYLQVIRLIEREPDDGTGDGRVRRYRPRPALRQLFVNRFRLQLSIIAPIAPEAEAVLARWDEPAVFDAFMRANGRFMIGSFLGYDHDAPNLNAFGHRNGGLTILGQIIIQAGREGAFPPPGPVRLNLSDLARRSGASRGQVRAVLKAGVEAGFLIDRPDGQTGFTQRLADQLLFLLQGYILSLAWCARLAAEGSVEPSAR